MPFQEAAVVVVEEAQQARLRVLLAQVEEEVDGVEYLYLHLI
jgi:hypothetical protein